MFEGGNTTFTLQKYGTTGASYSIDSPALDRLFDYVIGDMNSLTIETSSSDPNFPTFCPPVPSGVDPCRLSTYLNSNGNPSTGPSYLSLTTPPNYNEPNVPDTQDTYWYDDDAYSIGILGVGKSVFIKEMAVVLILSVSAHNDGDTVVQAYLQAYPPSPDSLWTLAYSFAELATSGLVANLKFTQQITAGAASSDLPEVVMPRLTVTTYAVANDVPASLYFVGDAELDTVFVSPMGQPSGAEFLLGPDGVAGQTQTIRGTIAYKHGIATFNLRPPVEPTQIAGDLGHLPDVAVGAVTIVSEPLRDSGNATYTAHAYSQIATLVPISVGSEQAYLPVLSKVTNLATPTNLRLNLSALMKSVSLSEGDVKNFLNGVDWSDFDKSQLGDFTLADRLVPLSLELKIDPTSTGRSGLIQSMSLCIENAKPWTIIATDTAVLKVDRAEIVITVFNPSLPDNRRYSVVIQGTIAVGTEGGLFNFSFDVGQLTVQLYLWEGEVTLSDVVALFMGGGDVDLPQIALNDFQLSIDAQNKSFKGGFSLASDWGIDVGPFILTLKELSVGLSYDANETDAATQFLLYGMVDLTGDGSGGGAVLESDLAMSAVYPGANEGWLFSGRGTTNCATIDDFITAVVGCFQTPSSPLPSFISDLELSSASVGVRFNTKTGSFAFDIEATWPEGAHPTVKFTVKNQKQASGTSQLVFEGSVVLQDEGGNALEFELIFEQSGTDSDIFLAYYQSDNPKDTTLSALVSQLTDNPPTDHDLEISLLEALFAYDNSSGTSKQMFSIGLGAALDLSALGDLPIIGDLFKDAPDLELALSVIYCTGTFSQQDMSILNSLLQNEKMRFPSDNVNGLTAGTYTSMVLRLGQGHYTTVDMSSAFPPSLSGFPPANGPMQPLAATGADMTQGIFWFNVQKTFGPLNLSRVGFGIKLSESRVYGYLDAALNIDVLTASFIELNVSFSLAGGDIGDIEFGLNGLGLEFQVDPVALEGTFLHNTVDDQTEYDGYATLKMGPLMLSAIGSYAKDVTTGHPSLFVFAAADFPIGGPGFFFVNGFSAGFAFNRDLILPPVSQVPYYWLVEAALGPQNIPKSPPLSGSTTPNPLSTILHSAEAYTPISVGQYWLAAGLKFTTYEIVNSLAVLSIGFGNRFEVDIIGLSSVLVPPTPGENISPIGEAQLALEASFIVETDPFSTSMVIQGQLTQNSYIFSKKCRLTGGFAFGAWIGGENNGDFVITWGGYHPDFKPPSYYPLVPRVGFNWNMAQYLNAKGNMYFALTPSAIMAGGVLELLFQLSVSGPIPSFRASFDLSLDFLLNWKPYHYEADTVAEVDVSLVIKSFGTHSISASAGADMDLWGPNFGGTAELHMSILFVKIHFNVSFGSANTGSEPVGSFQEVQDSFLPPPYSSTEQTPAPTAAAAATTSSSNLPEGISAPTTATNWNYVAGNVTAGLSGQTQVQASEGVRTYFQVDPKHLQITTKSVIPITQVSKDGAAWPGVDLDNFTVTGLGVAPMNRSITSALHTLSIGIQDDTDNETESYSDASSYFLPPIAYAADVPAALWNSQMLPTDDTSSVNGERLIENTVGGVTLVPATPAQPGASSSYAVKQFAFDTSSQSQAFSWNDTGAFTADPTKNPSSNTLADNLKSLLSTNQEMLSSETSQTRQGLLTSLGFTTQKIDLNQPLLSHTAYAPVYGSFATTQN